MLILLSVCPDGRAVVFQIWNSEERHRPSPRAVYCSSLRLSASTPSTGGGDNGDNGGNVRKATNSPFFKCQVRCRLSLYAQTPRATEPFSDSVLHTRKPTIAYWFLAPSGSERMKLRRDELERLCTVHEAQCGNSLKDVTHGYCDHELHGCLSIFDSP